MKTYHDHGNSYKGKHLIGLAYSFKDLVHYCHRRKHGGMEADMLLEKELKVLHMNPQAPGRELA